MLPLAELLALHDAHRPEGALERCLGDGYLIDVSPAFRRIRSTARELGATYTMEDFCHYTALRYASLDAILASGRIPYFDNVTILRELERRRPGRFRLHHVFELTPNYVLHESAHFIADRLAPPGSDAPAGPDPALAASRARMIAVNLGESFANATEMVTRLEIETAIDDRILDQNSYIRGRPRIAPSFRELVACVGSRAAFRVLLLGYLHANMLHDTLPEDRLAVVLELAGLGDNPAAALLASKVVPACFRLNPGFRHLTQAFYLTYLGIETPLEALLDFDFLGTILTSEPLRCYMTTLAAVIEGGPATAYLDNGGEDRLFSCR
jgi:hypothetical protein